MPKFTKKINQQSVHLPTFSIIENELKDAKLFTLSHCGLCRSSRTRTSTSCSSAWPSWTRSWSSSWWLKCQSLELSLNQNRSGLQSFTHTLSTQVRVVYKWCHTILNDFIPPVTLLKLRLTYCRHKVLDLSLFGP